MILSLLMTLAVAWGYTLDDRPIELEETWHSDWLDYEDDSLMEQWASLLSADCDRFAHSATTWNRVEVTNEVELRAAVAAGEQNPTEVVLMNDIVITSDLYAVRDVWIHGDSGRPQISADQGWWALNAYSAPTIAQNVHLSDLELHNVHFFAWNGNELFRTLDISAINVFVTFDVFGKFVAYDGYRWAEPLVSFNRADTSQPGITQVCGSVIRNLATTSGDALDPGMLRFRETDGLLLKNNLVLGQMRSGLYLNGSVNRNASCVGGAASCRVDWDPQRHNTNLVFEGNTIERSRKSRALGEDHGIYLHGQENVVIIGNRIRGWSNSGAGGCINARNLDGLVIEDNICGGSMLLYSDTYDGLDCLDTTTTLLNNPPMFQNVMVANNQLCSDYIPCEDGECGVCALMYSRYPVQSWVPWPSSPTRVKEHSVTLHNNDLNGGVVKLYSAKVKVGSYKCELVPGGATHPNEIEPEGTYYVPSAFEISDNVGMTTHGGEDACQWHKAVPSYGNQTSDGSPCR